MAVLTSGLVPEAPGAVPPAIARQPFMAEMPRFIVLELMIHHPGHPAASWSAT